jgi:hypothetical protein
VNITQINEDKLLTKVKQKLKETKMIKHEGKSERKTAKKTKVEIKIKDGNARKTKKNLRKEINWQMKEIRSIEMSRKTTNERPLATVWTNLCS